jgi:hypothetical protein
VCSSRKRYTAGVTTFRSGVTTSLKRMCGVRELEAGGLPRGVPRALEVACLRAASRHRVVAGATCAGVHGRRVWREQQSRHLSSLRKSTQSPVLGRAPISDLLRPESCIRATAFKTRLVVSLRASSIRSQKDSLASFAFSNSWRPSISRAVWTTRHRASSSIACKSSVVCTASTARLRPSCPSAHMHSMPWAELADSLTSACCGKMVAKLDCIWPYRPTGAQLY